MRTTKIRNTATQWARLAMKLGLLVTDPKTWADANQQLSERAEDVGDALKEKYDEAADRLHHAGRALRGEKSWVAPAVGFLGGIAVGAGLGVLFAPVSGEETRTALRNAAVDVRNKVSNISDPGFRSQAVS